MKILSFDPGKKHFAYAFFDGRRIAQFGFMKTILTSLKSEEYLSQTNVFAKSYKKLLAACDPDTIVIERFQYRPGMGKGAVSEFINIQIGLITLLSYPTPVTLIIPAQWKTYLHRTYTPQEDKKIKFEAKTLIEARLGFTGLTPHESDAMGMCYYINDKHKDRKTLP